ncbi:hypothetical protein SAMN04489867_3038 [Pedococcus dokdonensis]|uniref:Uncharacterized protein n=2 Tax=Pedococcus dokdonensis TaxID=443156 RepID=A0A1H0TY66_9MICO|nr:hypothetical protein SAMN04489867_3038 [Pedococcus dokdonensis]
MWLLSRDETSALVGVVTDPLQVRVTAGCAIGVPESPGLYRTLSAANSGLVVGRVYGVDNSAGGVNVVMQEIIMGAPLSFDHFPVMQDMVSRVSTVMNAAVRLGTDLRKEFGGRWCAPDLAYALID